MNVTDIPILSILIFLPLLGSIVLAVLPTTMTRPVALGTALLTWVVSLLLLVGFAPTSPGFQFKETLDWIPPSASSTSSASTASRWRSSCSRRR